MQRTVYAFAAVLIALPLAAQEHPIPRKSLPPAVEKTVQTQSAGATIKNVLSDREHGKLVYEIEMIVDGHTRDIEIAPDGTLNEVEEEVAFDTLPSSVQSALLARAAGAKVVKVESLTKHGKLVAYEAAILTGAHKSEFQVGPAGEKLAHSE